MLSYENDIETYQTLNTIEKLKIDLLLVLGHSLGYCLCYHKEYSL